MSGDLDMEISKIKNTIIIKKKLKSTETYKINKTSKFETISFYKKPQVLTGIASMTQDLKDVLFIDYDTDEKDLIIREYGLLQALFKLPQAYLFKTNKGYHVVCLKKFLPNQVFKILQNTHCDSAYTDMPIRNKYRNWILRISPKKNAKKPLFICLIGKPINKHEEVSNAHKEAFSKLYPKLYHPFYSNLDKYDKVFLQRYEAT